VVGFWFREALRPPFLVLILVRHGQSEANAAGLLVGRLDSALTELGLRQAAAIGEMLAAAADQPIRVLTSPLSRARHTAEIIAGSFGGELVPEVDDRLIELDYGELDGLRPAELGRGVWAGWRSNVTWRPPGGETLPDLHDRLEPLWDSVAADAAAGDVIAVTHVSPIKAAVAWVLGAGPELSWKLSLGVASITRITFKGPSPALVSFGEMGHLVSC
jgi:probable phosphoglycerate mutase